MSQIIQSGDKLSSHPQENQSIGRWVTFIIDTGKLGLLRKVRTQIVSRLWT